MKHTLLMLVCVAYAAAQAEVKPLVVTPAPFPLTVSEWTPPVRDFPITAYGATTNAPVTAALMQAIDAAHKAGGGRVCVPPGEWLTGGFTLKSNVALIVPLGCTLRFPDDPVIVYGAPLKANGRPNATRRGLIEAWGCTNVAIMGQGTLKADVAYWHRNFNYNPQKGYPRPQFFSFRNCANVRFEGFKVRGSPAWTMHFILCTDIVLRDLDSICTGPNTDGLDLESCNRALVERVSLDQTDDTFTIKSGMNAAGRTRNVPTQNVVIRDCRAVHGHSLLGIGSEVSGGIRNIYMTNCSVAEECWRFLYVKTNSKRGAFVENVTLENITGRRASQAVMEVEMYYDGNPNKELSKNMVSEFPTRIQGITCRNVTCAEAGAAVRVRGDKTLPPTGLVAENIVVGRLRTPGARLVITNTAPDLIVRNVTLDKKAFNKALNLPDHVRLFDATETASEDVVIDRSGFEDRADNDVMMSVLDTRITAECRSGRNVVPRIVPADRAKVPVGISSGHIKRMEEALADWGCGIAGALIADDVRRVTCARDVLGARLTVDAAEGTARLVLTNNGTNDITDLFIVFYAPMHYMTHRQVFRVTNLPAKRTSTHVIELGAGAHYLPLPQGDAPFAAQVDFTHAATRTRVWCRTTCPTQPSHPNIQTISDAACVAGPLDVAVADDATLCALSASTDPLPGFDTAGGAWRPARASGLAGSVVNGPARAYTALERGMARTGRGAEVVALAFDVPSFAQVMFRTTAWQWDANAMVFLNGQKLDKKAAYAILPTKAGYNRLLVRYALPPGDIKKCVHVAVYTWSHVNSVTCLPLKTQSAPKAQHVDAADFSLEWNPTYATTVPYEVEISRAKLAHLVGVTPDCGFEVTAHKQDGTTAPLAVTLLPARAAGAVRLRFAVPQGTVALTARACSQARVSDANLLPDNLLAGALTAQAKWATSPRMARVHPAAGTLELAAKDWGAPEGTLVVPVPAAYRGQGVVFEACAQNVGKQCAGRVIRVEQLDAAQNVLAESVVDRRWTSHVCPPGEVQHYLEEGRLHKEAAFVRLYIKCIASSRQYDLYGRQRTKEERADRSTLPRHRLTCLSLRPAAVLPFPKYDEHVFTAGVSGAADDTALVLGGDQERAFWYQTRSNASWSDGNQLRDERHIFFPSGAGTVEAWFKSSWDVVANAADKKKPCYPYTLFDAYHGFKATEHLSGVGSLITLSYYPKPGTLRAFFREVTDRKKTWETEVPCTLPAGAWCHVALQWTPEKEAEVFVDGRKVLTLAIPGWKACNLKDETIRIINDCSAHELFVGAAYKSAREATKPLAHLPFVTGALDSVRVSTGLRYAGAFTPAKRFVCDADTRALFTFDRALDGVSAGGLAWIPASYRALQDRTAHTLHANGKDVQYWPKEPTVENDPRCVFDIVNYPTLPKPEDFTAMRKTFTHQATLKSGETFSFTAAEKALTEYVEIANVSAEPLVWPILLNTGDVDARSFGDLKDTLALEGLSPRARADKVFQYVLSAADYYPIHTAMFGPGSDKPYDVEYECLTVLNGYCGFECGPMNHLAANLFAAVARCPSAGTGGYAHAFQEVFFEGKNHIYDVSAQKFFPAMDNETSAYLKEAGDQTGMFHRYGMTGDHFIRKSDRRTGLFGLADVPKVGITLNPGESFRVWQVNDGTCNDLIAECKTGPWRGYADKSKPEMDAETHADTTRWAIRQVNRFFPHFLNGFIAYAGPVTAANPAFSALTPTSFCYRVTSGYPIVAGNYRAEMADGAVAPLEISTDFGKSFRPLAVPATYAVRARFDYLVRVQAAPANVRRFTASTEVQINPRTFPGRIHPGALNCYTLKAEKGGAARVTVAGRNYVQPLTIKGPVVYSGTIVGCERIFTAFDSAQTCTLTVEGLTPHATVRSFGSVTGALSGDQLTLRANANGTRGFGAVIISEGGAEQEITVYTAPGVRFATAQQAKVKGAQAAFRDPDEMSPQRRVLFKGHCGDGSEAEFHFDTAPAGQYIVYNLNRFIAHPEPNAPFDLRLIWKGQKGKSVDFGAPRNKSINFWKANYARKGDRANFKWDYCTSIRDVPASDAVRVFSWRQDPVEVAAVLAVPLPSRAERAEIMKILCGMNVDPWRMQGK